MTAHVFDLAFRFGFLPAVLFFASVALIRNTVALLRDVAHPTGMDVQRGRIPDERCG